MIIRTITPQNLIYIEFSEPVMVIDETGLTPENIAIKIEGKNSQYIFNWRIIEDPRNQLVPNRTITKFQVKLSDMKQSLDGTE